MKPRSLINLAMLAWLMALPVGGAEFLAAGKPFKEDASLPAGKKAGNLYAVAATLSIQGPVQGDLYAAGRQILVSAPVKGNVEAICGSLNLQSSVGGNARLVAGRLKVTGPVDEDLVAAARYLEVTSEALVKGDAVLAGVDVVVAGPVSGRAWIAGTRVRLEGPIRGKAVVHYDQSLVLGKGCRLKGKLECYGPRPPEIPAGFPVSDVDYHPAEGLSTMISSLSRWTAVFGLPALLWLASWLLAAWFWVRLFPGALANVLRTLEKDPWQNLGWGFLALTAGLVGIPLLFLTLVGCYVSLLAGTLLLAALLAARLLAVFYLAFLLRLFLEKKREPALPFRWVAGGILVIHLTGLLPWFGCVVSVGLSLAALGALIREAKAMGKGRGLIR